MTNYVDKSNGITEGLRKSFQSTDCKMANSRCYGYDTSPNGDLIANQTEAEVVRWIFERYLAGESFGKIAAGLEQHGVLSPTGRAKWNREAISKLLSNEKYTGSILLQKTMSICGTQLKNEGELEQVLITHHHESIISVQDFETVQQMKIERAKTPLPKIASCEYHYEKLTAYLLNRKCLCAYIHFKVRPFTLLTIIFSSLAILRSCEYNTFIKYTWVG